jgi:hypothetical protein
MLMEYGLVSKREILSGYDIQLVPKLLKLWKHISNNFWDILSEPR